MHILMVVLSEHSNVQKIEKKQQTFPSSGDSCNIATDCPLVVYSLCLTIQVTSFISFRPHI